MVQVGQRITWFSDDGKQALNGSVISVDPEKKRFSVAWDEPSILQYSAHVPMGLLGRGRWEVAPTQ